MAIRLSVGSNPRLGVPLGERMIDIEKTLTVHPLYQPRNVMLCGRSRRTGVELRKRKLS